MTPTRGEPVGESSSKSPGPPHAEMDRVREGLTRAVARLCPRWLADQREDIVQNACLRVVRIFQESKEPVPLGASYLWRTAHSAVMDEIRKRGRRREVDMESLPPQPAPPVSSPEGQHAGAELRRAVEEGLGELSEPRRRAVLLYLYGFTLRESANVLGWKTKRVDNQRYQGLATLREYLKQRGFEP